MIITSTIILIKQFKNEPVKETFENDFFNFKNI